MWGVTASLLKPLPFHARCWHTHTYCGPLRWWYGTSSDKMGQMENRIRRCIGNDILWLVHWVVQSMWTHPDGVVCSLRSIQQIIGRIQTVHHSKSLSICMPGIQKCELAHIGNKNSRPIAQRGANLLIIYCWG